MKVFLALDQSPCSEAAVEAVLRQFPSDDAEVRVLHVDEWPKGLPASLAFAEGPAAASDILAAHDDLRRQAEALLSRAAARLTAAGFRAETELRQGDARDEILKCAADWQRT